jgi:hypothetical protein
MKALDAEQKFRKDVVNGSLEKGKNCVDRHNHPHYFGDSAARRF